jgi:acetyltransferase-like isoleucine patch superfamily enzyme
MIEHFIPQHPSLRANARNWRWKIGVLKWLLFCFKFQILKFLPGKAKLISGKRISLQGKIRIVGPGTVIIEDDVILADQVDLFTHSQTAVIRLGEKSFLNGTRISSTDQVEIGPLNIVADVRIMDTDFHWIHRERMSDHRPPPTARVKTESNVWIAAASALMKGTTIRENSVVAFGSVVTGTIPENEIWGGVPAKKIGDVPEKDAHV